MRVRLEKITFFSIVLFLPVQLGKHFWPAFSFVTGVRVDYLSPTLYVTDILIVILFIATLLHSSIVKQIRLNLNRVLNHLPRTLFFLFVFTLVLGMIAAKSPQAAFYGIIKILEFSFLGLYVAKNFRKKNIEALVTIFSVDVVVVSLITIWQFLQQGSIGGLWYFLGERTFTSSTIGIANMNIDGTLVLRPYATFPHPNVLAFFLFFANMIIFYRLFYEKKNIKKMLSIFILMVSSVALFLTFSRVIILLYVIIAFYLGLKYIRKKIVILITLAFLFFLFVSTSFSYRFFDSASLIRDWRMRAELINISMSLFKKHPYFGAGLKNFFYYQPLYQKTITPTLFQPVHNIFILVLVETGVVGFIIFCTFLIHTFRVLLRKIKKVRDREVKDFYKATMVIFVSMIIVGMFDHFFLTLQQGQLVLALILGFAWTRMK